MESDNNSIYVNKQIDKPWRAPNNKIEEGDIIIIDVDMAKAENTISFEVEGKQYDLSRKTRSQSGEYR